MAKMYKDQNGNLYVLCQKCKKALESGEDDEDYHFKEVRQETAICERCGD